MTNLRRFIVVLWVAFVFASCGGCNDGDISSKDDSGETSPIRIELPGIGPNGVFDASLTEDENGRIWMSYSEVDFSPIEPTLRHISTRIAFSDSNGEQWQDSGNVVNAAEPITLPPPWEDWPAVWEHEVSRLAYDPHARSEERWKLLWHRVLNVSDGISDEPLRLFEHSWIAMKTAPSPEGPWSQERKLFVGSMYDDASDSDSIGPPEYRLDQLFPEPDDLGSCAAFTEPGVLVTEEGVYVSLTCSEGALGGKIVLLRCDHNFSTCDYLGDLINDSEARAFNINHNGFSAPELVQKGDQTFLLVTPTEGLGKLYRGCLVFRVKDLQTASLDRNLDTDIPVVVLSICGSSDSFNGACGYTAGSTRSGIIYSEFFPGQVPEFRLFSSGKNL